jgi:hypothetical protein
MNDPTAKIRRLSQLPQQIAPPRDGWPTLEARLRELSGVPHESAAATPAPETRARRRGVRAFGVLSALVAAVLAGVVLDRWMLQPAPTRPSAGAHSTQPQRTLPVAFLTDPRYEREQTVLLRSLDARLHALPPPTRRRVLQSLATLEQSAREIRSALGQQPGNALLQALLIDTYQDEMQLLSTAQEMGGAGHEAST